MKKKDMAKLIDEYFDELKGGEATDSNGDIIYVKDRPMMIADKPPTVAGLCRALGLGSREELWEIASDGNKGEVVRSALMRIEEYTESRLFDKDTAKGAETILKNEFSWRDRPEEKTQQHCGVVILSEVDEG